MLVFPTDWSPRKTCSSSRISRVPCVASNSFPTVLRCEKRTSLYFARGDTLPPLAIYKTCRVSFTSTRSVKTTAALCCSHLSTCSCKLSLPQEKGKHASAGVYDSSITTTRRLDISEAHSPNYTAVPGQSSAAHACSPAGQPAGAAVCPIPALASRVCLMIYGACFAAPS